MWNPNEDGYLELIKLFTASKSNDNKTQQDIFKVRLL
jgi:hypothetical protein